MKLFPIVIVIALLAGCTHTYNMTVDSNFVGSMPNQFKSEKLSQKKACLVISPEFKNYVFEKKAYNWAWGNTFKDTLYFELGKPISLEIDNLLSTMFAELCRASDIKDAVGKNSLIIKPEFVSCALDLPTVRFEDIKSEIQLKYTFYSSGGKQIISQPVTGHGNKVLVMRKENYNIAFQEAIKDLISRSKPIIENSVYDDSHSSDKPQARESQKSNSEEPANSGKDSSFKSLPPEVKEEIKRKCAKDHPGDFAMQADCANRQATGWLGLNK